MDACRHRRLVPGSVKEEYDDRTGRCADCHQEVRSFYIDDEDDRRGGWSSWSAKPFIIEEEQELTWSVNDLLAI
jgi:hypothetical protein